MKAYNKNIKRKKHSGSWKNIKLVFFAFIGWGILTLFFNAAEYIEKAKLIFLKADYPVFVRNYTTGQKYFKKEQYQAAVDSYKLAIDSFNHQREFPTPFIYSTYRKKAEAHIKLWEYLYAIDNLETALKYAAPGDKNEVTRRLNRVRDIIESGEIERNLKNSYLASPGVGNAKNFRGKVLVIYVFVDDGKNSQWGKSEMRQVLSSFQEVEQWYRKNAQSHGIQDLTFQKRVFVYDKDPLLRNVFQSVVQKRNIRLGYDLVGRIANLNGHTNIHKYLERLKNQEGADQVMLYLHINKSARSYAIRCKYSCINMGEYTFLFETPFHNNWDALQYVQAHEGLHLFGADDLYNIKDAKQYGPTDIMNYVTRYLNSADLSPITRFAIGWTRYQPQTPFKVNTTGEKP